jgi:ABC-type transporter Mla subunit MlaD
VKRALAIGAVVTVAVVLVVLLLSGTGVIGGGSGGYKVEALFDNAAFAVPGEEVRVAGATVGTISALSVTKQNVAAVTLTINNKDFTPFYANATCTIRPQSLIAERYVDCAPGTVGHRHLRQIRSGYGAGSYLLPVTQTSSPIDPDIVQDVSQDSVRESLSVILNELGTGLAGRGADLKAVILRADPALAQTEAVFKILGSQNKLLAELASDSNRVLGPLAKARNSLSDFVVQANTTAIASAQRSADISQSIKLLPGFLKQLKPLMADLGQLASQGTPVMTSLGSGASAIDSEFKSLVPFATQAQSALKNLGSAAQQSESSLVASQPLANQLKSLGSAALPSSTSLDSLLTSLNTTGGIQQFMGLLFYGASATNGYDADGHYVRIAPVVGSCNAYAKVPVAGCSAKFATTGAAASVATQAARQALRSSSASTSALGGLMRYLVGSGSSTASTKATKATKATGGSGK